MLKSVVSSFLWEHALQLQLSCAGRPSAAAEWQALTLHERAAAVVMSTFVAAGAVAAAN